MSTELPQKQHQQETTMSKRTAINSVGSEQCKKVKTQDKKAILESEANARSLAKTKVAYSRRGEEKDTLIVRDLYTGTRFDRFGVKGDDQLEQIFHVILGVLNVHRATLLKRMCFGGDALREMLDGLSDSDHEAMRTALEGYYSNTVLSTKKIELKKLDTFPQLELLQYEADGTLANGIYLFVSEAVKLVKHMNTVFAFSKSECLSFFEKAPIEKYADDNFF